MLTVLLIDDHPIIVAACRSLLEGSGITTILEAADPTSGYEAFVEHEPDVIIVDLRFRGDDLGGLALIERMRAHDPQAAILVFSMHLDPRVVTAAIEAGATGYILKGAPLEEFLKAVEEVRSGRRYMDHALALTIALVRTKAEGSPIDAFTPRERQALALLAQGTLSSDR